MSSGKPTRCIGTEAAMRCWIAGSWAWPPPMLVTKKPGAMALTVML